jgi:2',3'-cyclic-nucleotide 2'-phosphodiesterase (5'-nucleotidase family)
MKKIAIVILIALSWGACHQPGKVVSKTSKIHMIDSTLDAIQDTQYLAYLEPIKTELETQLNEAIGYAPKDLEVYQPECPMLNWASDALYEMAKQLCPEQVDMAVVNIGGMRCNWGTGNITFRHVFELMPFDNELVVLTMTGKEILALCDVFAKCGGQGVAGLRMSASKGVLRSAKIAGIDVVPEAYYTVATSDYLSQGNDGMTPLKNYEAMWKSERKIRDLYIEYIQQVKTVEAKVDGRMDVGL